MLDKCVLTVSRQGPEYSYAANEIESSILFIKTTFYCKLNVITVLISRCLFGPVDFNRQVRHSKCGNIVGNIYMKLPTTMVFYSCGIIVAFCLDQVTYRLTH